MTLTTIVVWVICSATSIGNNCAALDHKTYRSPQACQAAAAQIPVSRCAPFTMMEMSIMLPEEDRT